MVNAYDMYAWDGGSYDQHGNIITIRYCAEKYGVSKDTLIIKLNKEVNLAAGLGRHAPLSRKEESILVEHLFNMASIGYGYDRIQVLNMIRNLIKGRNMRNVSEILSTKGYFESLQCRFPQLSIRKVQAFDRLRYWSYCFPSNYSHDPYID